METQNLTELKKEFEKEMRKLIFNFSQKIGNVEFQVISANFFEKLEKGSVLTNTLIEVKIKL